MEKVQSVRGTYDLFGAAKRKMKKVVAVGSQVVEKYGFEEIETPIFEFTEVFARNLGDTSDIVTKEMYCFNDKGGESLTLRPEGTAGVVRAFVSNGMQQNLPVKFYYSGPMFRYERPQKGRQRQFTQFGVELLGVGLCFIGRTLPPYGGVRFLLPPLVAVFYQQVGSCRTMFLQALGRIAGRPVAVATRTATLVDVVGKTIDG
jgi:hypothetical protein